ISRLIPSQNPLPKLRPETLNTHKQEITANKHNTFPKRPVNPAFSEYLSEKFLKGEGHNEY
ncbi:MAG: hypothetical protein LUC51_08345, partial [Cloacibacillus porcorum]|nr:hypothetical protein [Cloacibacillus porcorum]